MKNIIALCLILTIGFVCLLQSQTWDLEITGVSQQSITANLSVTNNTNSTINWTYPGYPLFGLLVDGVSTLWGYFPAIMFVNLQPGESFSDAVGYSLMGDNPPQLIPLGQHTIQGCENRTGFPPVGPVQTVTVFETYHFIDFDIQTEGISQDSLSFTLRMTNTDVYPFKMYYGWNWIRMRVDGSNVDVMPHHSPGHVTIQPDSTYARRIVYDSGITLTPGYYEVNFSFQNVLYEPDYAYPQTFYVLVEPISIDDEVLTPGRLSAYPNPFNQAVTIKIDCKSPVPVSTSIYNIKGQLVKSFDKSKSFVWNGEDEQGNSVSNGIYFIKAVQDGKTVSRKVIRIK